MVLLSRHWSIRVPLTATFNAWNIHGRAPSGAAIRYEPNGGRHVMKALPYPLVLSLINQSHNHEQETENFDLNKPLYLSRASLNLWMNIIFFKLYESSVSVLEMKVESEWQRYWKAAYRVGKSGAGIRERAESVISKFVDDWLSQLTSQFSGESQGQSCMANFIVVTASNQYGRDPLQSCQHSRAQNQRESMKGAVQCRAAHFAYIQGWLLSQAHPQPWRRRKPLAFFSVSFPTRKKKERKKEKAGNCRAETEMKGRKINRN